jgi:hypothetical protein
MPIILATREAEIRRITVQRKANGCETLSPKSPSHTHTQMAVGVVQDVVPEFKPLYHKKQNKTKQKTGLEEVAEWLKW